MGTREIVNAYYTTVNTADWDSWLELFSENTVMDEQLAGHLEGIAVLRGAIGGLKRGYSKFQNVPQHIIIDGDQATVVSHISAANASGVPIEANVANYFQVTDGKITYMANFHDTVPFGPFVNQKFD